MCEPYYTSTFTMARYSIQNTDSSIVQLGPQTGQKNEVLKGKKTRPTSLWKDASAQSRNLLDVHYIPGIQFLMGTFVHTLEGKRKKKKRRIYQWHPTNVEECDRWLQRALKQKIQSTKSVRAIETSPRRTINTSVRFARSNFIKTVQLEQGRNHTIPPYEARAVTKRQ